MSSATRTERQEGAGSSANFLSKERKKLTVEITFKEHTYLKKTALNNDVYVRDLIQEAIAFYLKPKYGDLE